MSLLSRAFGLQPNRAYAVRVQRDLVIPAGDGVPLLANRFYPADIDRPPLVLLRSPYGRGVALDRMPQLVAERGYQVLYVSLRGTGGSGGEFDGFTLTRPTPTACCRGCASSRGLAVCWPPGAPATSVSPSGSSPPATSRNGRSRSSRTRRRSSPISSCIQAADSRWATRSVGCRSSIACFVPTVEWPASSSACSPAPESMRRAVATLPVADADIALTGRRVGWFQEWIRHGPDDPYWQASDHRANVVRMPPVVYLQGGWYDFFLRGMLADYAALQAAGRAVRLLIGPWGHGRGLYTRVGMRDALAALDAALADGTPTFGGAGVRYRFPPLDRPARLAPACPRHRMVSASGRPARRPPSLRWPIRAGFAMTRRIPTPSIAGTAVGLSAGPADNRRLEARPDVLTFTSDPQAADLEVIGPVRVRLYVQASVAHIDLHARLCDVTPRGRSINISDGIVRLTDAAPDTPLSGRV